MRAFADTTILPRRGLIATLIALFILWVCSQYLFRYAHWQAYDFTIAWTYLVGFLRYMVTPWALTLLLALIGYVIGRFMIRLVARGLKFRNILEESIHAIGIGLGIISIITFLVGLAGILYPIAFGIIAVMVLILGRGHVVHLYQGIRRGLRPAQWDILEGALLLLIGACILNSFLLPNNPSTGFDPINSHLCAPKYYLRDHAVTFIPWINFNNFPQVQEMLLTLEMMVLEDPGSSLIYFFMVLSTILTYMIGARYFGRRVGLIACVLFLFINNVFDMSQRAFVEHLLGFYVLLLVHAFLAWYETRDGRWVILLGIVGGLSCGVKYTATINVLLVLLLMVIARFMPVKKWEKELILRESQPPREKIEKKTRKKTKAHKQATGKRKTGVKQSRKATGARTTATEPDDSTESGEKKPAGEIESTAVKPVSFGLGKSLGLALLWTVVIASPWYIRSIVLFGNPFFPFFESIFGGLGIGTLDSMRDQLAVDHSEMLKYFHFKPTLRNLAVLPWHFTFHDNSPWLWRGSPGTIGPFLLAFTPAVIFIRRWRRVGIMLIMYLLIYYSYWFLLERIEDQRYMMSAYPLHCIVTAWGITDIFRLESFNRLNRTHLAWILLVAALGFGTFYRSIMGPHKGTSIAFVENRRQSYLTNNIKGYDIVKWINYGIDASGRLGGDDSDLVFTRDTIIYGLAMEHRRYYLDCPLIGGLFGYADHFELGNHSSTGRELYDWLNDLGCDYLIYDSSRTLRMAYAFTLELPTDPTFEEHFRELRTSGDVHLYQLVP